MQRSDMSTAMELKVGIDESFIVDGLPFSYPSSSGSFSSSSASSTCDPFTPTSGRSSPGHRFGSVGYESSFCDVPLDMTPATSGPEFLPADFATSLEPEYLCSTSPSTPSRHGSIVDMAAAHHAQACLAHAQVMPQHGLPMDTYPFSEDLSSPTYIFPTPAQSLHNDSCVEMSDFSSMMAAEDSPILSFFEERQSYLKAMPPLDDEETNYSFSSGSSSSSGSTHRRRLFADEAQHKSAALQKMLDPATGEKQSRASRPSKGERAQKMVFTTDGLEVPRVPSGAFKCDWPGCVSKNGRVAQFNRREHLKRHMKTHMPDPEFVECSFCGHVFPRRDNWRQHTLLHAFPKKNSRTKYFPEARYVYEQEMTRIARRRPSKERRPGKEAA